MWIILGAICISILYSLLSSTSKSKPTVTSKSPYRPQQNTYRRDFPSSIISKPSPPKVFKSKSKLPDNLVITEEFQIAFDLLENSTKCAYITGKAGTGKSTLLI